MKSKSSKAKPKPARTKRVSNLVRHAISNYLGNCKYTEKLSNSAVAHTLGTVNGERVTALHVQAVRASMKRKQEAKEAAKKRAQKAISGFLRTEMELAIANHPQATDAELAVRFPRFIGAEGVAQVRAGLKKKREARHVAISLHPLDTAESALERIERELIEAKEELARTRSLFECVTAGIQERIRVQR